MSTIFLVVVISVIAIILSHILIQAGIFDDTISKVRQIKDKVALK